MKIKVKARAIETFYYRHEFELEIPDGLSEQDHENAIFDLGLTEMERLGTTSSEYEEINIEEIK